jgi:NAD(P)-dependent dehydrogenase (short-subunit alcohol dehydrogenase family)
MMKESLRLQDKSVLIHGDFSGLTQALIRDFTEQGADVGFINHEKPQTARYLENVNDGRQVHANLGRAAQIDVEVKDKASASEAVGRMAEVFGRIDILVDVRVSALKEPEVNAAELLMAQVEPFFKSKKKGRVVFVREDESLSTVLHNSVGVNVAEEFLPWASKLSKDWAAPGFGINTVTVGLTEDLILKKFPQGKSIRSSLETLQKEMPGLQLIDANDITSVVLFLSSVGASGLTGQRLRVLRRAD